MTYLVDTCVLSEVTKPRPAASVLAWLEKTDPDSLYLSVLTFGELEKGIERLPDGRRKNELRRWLVEVRAESAGRVLPIDDAAASEWGRMAARAEKAGMPVPTVDALIAATAIVHGLTVVTRNEADIGRAGASVFDPWSTPHRSR